jgi:WD40 repeat protein
MGWIIPLVLLQIGVLSFAGSSALLWSYSIEGITAVAVSENGDYIAVGCQDGWYYLFDTWGNRTGSGQVPAAVDSLAIANTGKVLVSSAAGYTFCTKDGVQGSSFQSPPVKTVSISSDGISSLVCAQENVYINIEDSMVQQLQVGGDNPFGVMSPDGTFACAVSGRHLFLFFDGEFHGPSTFLEDIDNVFVSADGSTIVFSTQKEIGYKDTKTLKTYTVNLDASLTSMAVSADGSTVVGSTTDTVLWIKEGVIIHTIPADGIHCLSLSEDGTLAVLKEEDTIHIMKNGAPVFTYDCESTILTSAIAEDILVVCTHNSIYTFQLFKKTKNNNNFVPLSSRKSLPLTSPFKELWSVPVAEDASFLTGDVDGDGLTDIILRDETMVKLFDSNGTQKSAKNFEEPIIVAPPLDFDGDTRCEIPIIFEHEGFIFSIYDWKRGFTRTYNLESLRDQPSPEGCVIPFAVVESDDGTVEILATVYVGYLCKPRGVVSIDYLSGDITWFYQMGSCPWADIVEDIDGDSTIEMVFGSIALCNCPNDEHFPDCETYVTAFSLIGEQRWNLSVGKGYKRVKICTADVNNHEGLEIIGTAYEASENWGNLFVLTCSGEFLYNFETEYALYPGAVVDITDNNKEIITLDSRGYISVFTPDLQLKSEKFIKDSINSSSSMLVNDLDGDGRYDIVVGVDNELYLLDTNLKVVWKKELEGNIKDVKVANFNQCKNLLLVLSDKLYAFSYQGVSPCPLWEITERIALKEATTYITTAESHFAAKEYQASKQDYQIALAVFTQLEDQDMVDTISKRIETITDIIFKVTVKMGGTALAVGDVVICVFLVYSWMRKRWSRLAEGALLLTLPILFGLFQVYYASQEYTLVFTGYAVPLFILFSTVFLRKNILVFLRTVAAFLGGHKDMLVLSITQANGAYRVSVESIEEKFKPVKESKEIVFPPERKRALVKKEGFITGILSQYSSANVEKSLDYVKEILKETGTDIYKNFIPDDFSDILKAKFLLLEVDDTEIPWELMYSDTFFAVHYAISRRIVSTESVNVRPCGNHQKRALVISDPTQTLPGAKTECTIVYNRLKQKMDVSLVEGCDATLQKVANMLGQGFDIIHYAGHVDTGLVLSDGVMNPQNVREFVIGTPIVFVNGCTSEDLTRAFLLGGALCYVGTIHPIHDGSAAGIAADFYDLCLQYQIGEALRRAREDHMDKDLVWASLVMYGDPTLKLL